MQNFLFDLIKNLTINEIDFVICGGVACIMQGCERTTFDIDINIYMDQNNIEKIIRFFKANNFISRIPEPFESLLNKEKRNEWIIQKQAQVYTVYDSKGLLQVDIFLQYPIEYSKLKENADLFDIDGIQVYVSSINDLIFAKKQVNPIRKKDLEDIETLMELSNEKE